MEMAKVWVVQVSRSDHKLRKIIWDNRSEHASFREAQEAARVAGEYPYRIVSRLVAAPADPAAIVAMQLAPPAAA